jgi:hypothetical protein
MTAHLSQRQLFPNPKPEQAMADLMLERARKNLTFHN